MAKIKILQNVRNGTSYLPMDRLSKKITPKNQLFGYNQDMVSFEQYPTSPFHVVLEL